MTRANLTLQLGGRLAALSLALAASSALAQTATPSDVAPPVAPGTTAGDVASAPGLPGPDSVDPAPGATGPYAGHSEQAFYDVDGRIARYQARAEALTGGRKQGALKGLASIRAEEKQQIASHGSLLDWARENLNHRLDQLKQAYPELAA